MNLSGASDRYCAASSFVDSFEQPILSQQWRELWNSETCRYSTLDGQLHINQDGSDMCRLASRLAVDLTDSDISMALQPGTADACLQLRHDSINRLELCVAYKGGASTIWGSETSTDSKQYFLPIDVAGEVVEIGFTHHKGLVQWRGRTDTEPFVLESRITAVDVTGLSPEIHLVSTEGGAIVIDGVNAQ